MNEDEMTGLEAIMAISTMVIVSVIIALGFLGPIIFEVR